MANTIYLEGGAYAVQRVRIIGTPFVVYSAWERRAPDHRVHTTIGAERYGKVTSRALPADIAALPVGAERFAMVDAWRAELERQAIALIREAYPEAVASGQATHGDVEVCSDAHAEEVSPSACRIAA